MKLVIEIDDKVYEYIKSIPLHTMLEEAVIDGTPLPKDHGRIGDLDALREEVSSWGMNDYEPSDFIDAIDQADTIIEADIPTMYYPQVEGITPIIIEADKEETTK